MPVRSRSNEFGKQPSARRHPHIHPLRSSWRSYGIPCYIPLSLKHRRLVQLLFVLLLHFLHRLSLNLDPLPRTPHLLPIILGDLPLRTPLTLNLTPLPPLPPPLHPTRGPSPIHLLRNPLFPSPRRRSRRRSLPLPRGRPIPLPRRRGRRTPLPTTKRSPILLLQLLLRDAQEFASGGGGGEVGEGFEFLVVDLSTLPIVSDVAMLERGGRHTLPLARFPSIARRGLGTRIVWPREAFWLKVGFGEGWLEGGKSLLVGCCGRLWLCWDGGCEFVLKQKVWSEEREVNVFRVNRGGD